MQNNKRSGFTLVELLIVIVVIGVLSAMMMLSSTEAVSSAKASNIISDLRNLKTAVLSWYTDNMDRVTLEGDTYKIDKADISAFLDNENKKNEILKYLNNNSSISLKKRGAASNQGDYTIVGALKSKKWYVCYKIGNDTRIKEKLTSKAKSLGLVGVAAVSGGVDDSFGSEYSGHDYVCLLALSLGN